jgi:hypothetical protein
MRHARSAAGQNPDGEPLVTYRSPGIMRDGPSGVSFHGWAETDPLPPYDDDVSGFELFSPGCFPEEIVEPRSEDHPGHCPDRPDFAPSFVHVPAPPTVPIGDGSSSFMRIPQPGAVIPEPLPRRSSRVPAVAKPVGEASEPRARKLVTQRWFCEPASRPVRQDPQQLSLICSCPGVTFGPGNSPCSVIPST